MDFAGGRRKFVVGNCKWYVSQQGMLVRLADVGELFGDSALGMLTDSVEEVAGGLGKELLKGLVFKI